MYKRKKWWILNKFKYCIPKKYFATCFLDAGKECLFSHFFLMKIYYTGRLDVNCE